MQGKTSDEWVQYIGIRQETEKSGQRKRLSMEKQNGEYTNIILNFSTKGANEYTGDNSTVDKTTALVNSANPTLIGGSGIAAVIQKEGGKDLVSELTELGKKGCKVTENKATKAHGLGNKFDLIIHAVAPDFRHIDKGFVSSDRNIGNVCSFQIEEPVSFFSSASPDSRAGNESKAQQALNAFYLNILERAQEKGVSEISCPLASTGAFNHKGGVLGFVNKLTGNNNIFTPDKLAEMTIKALHYADKNITTENPNQIKLTLCTFEKGKEGEANSYFNLLQKHNNNKTEVKQREL